MERGVGHMSAEEFREVGRRVIDWVADWMERSREGRAGPVLSRVKPGEIAAMLPERGPERGEGWDALLADLERVVAPGVTNWQSPQFYGYFPCNATGPAILAEIVSAGLNGQGMLWSTSPAYTEIETRAMDWLGELIGLPGKFASSTGVGAGVIQGTASEAALVCIVAARERAMRVGVASPHPAAAPPPSPERGVGAGAPHPSLSRGERGGREQGEGGGRLRLEEMTAYCSSQAHSSIAKDCRIAGLPRENLRLVEVDDRLRMRADALSRRVAEDRAAGLMPFFVCATVGTTSSGAVDPVAEVGAVARREGMWLHVDAAWAGAACVCPEHRGLLSGVDLADSFNFNPHKWLLTNFDCSALWVADRRDLIDALSITPEYLRNAASESGAVIDYRDWQAPLGRRFRALKLWWVMRRYGADGLRAHIRAHVRCGEVFESLVRGDERFEMGAERSLSLVCFRLRAGDEATRRLHERLNASGRMFLSHTVLPSAGGGPGRYTLRMAIGGVWTAEEHVRAAWGWIAEEAGRA